MSGVVARPDLWANFIWPAYGLTLLGLVGLLAWAYFSMRGAERRADDVKRPRGSQQ
jgi:heme exporter protein CcmD